MLRLPEGFRGRIGVALSGGGDSTALLHMLREAGHPVEAATVDHRLRAESGDEARRVARDCAALGIAHRILVWERAGADDDLPGGNLMEAASAARRALLAAWAQGRGLDAVALAHTADDQAEQLLIGLSRAAGIDGLAGMRADWVEAGTRWLRPLLGAGRGVLRDWLASRGISWIDDPTNADPRYLRVRMRHALAQLAPLGLTPARLAASTAHLAEARAALVAAAAAVAPRVCHEAAGALRLDGPALAALPPETARRLLRAAVQWLSGRRHAPRAEALARLMAAVAGGRAATLHGCRLRGGWLAREAAAGPDPRWHVDLPEGLALRPLGPEGLRAATGWRATGLPAHVLAVTPSLWRGGVLVAAPLAGFGPPVPVGLWPAFAEFVAAH